MTVRTVKLGDVIEINPRSNHSLDSDSNVAFLSMADISEDGQILATQTRPLSEVAKGYTSFQNGDVLLAKITPCFENGKAALVHGMFSDVAFGSTEFHVLRPTEEINGRYLYHLVWNPAFRAAGARRMTGSAGQKRVPTAFLSDFEIALPRFEEQKRIAAILDKAESLRRKRQEAIELADAFLHAVFVKIARQSSERTSIESLLADVPNAIRTGPFGSQLLVSEFTESGTAVLGIDNVVTNRFTWNERRYISAEKFEQLARYTVFPGDVMITIMGTTGRVAIAPKELPRCISTKHLCTMTVNQEKITPEYLWASLRWDTDVRAQTAREGKGAIMEGWNMGIIKGLKVTRPPIHVQRKFSQALTQTRHITDLLMSSKLQGSALISSLSEIMLNEGNPF